MTLRADHVAGAAFAALGVVIIALSGDLPFGELSMPGAGFLPRLLAALTIIFGLALILRGRESEPFSALAWDDGRHALLILVIAGVAIFLYTVAGFIISMLGMMIALLVIIERRHPVRAIVYSAVVVMLTYVVFVYALKTPMPTGPWGF